MRLIILASDQYRGYRSLKKNPKKFSFCAFVKESNIKDFWTFYVRLFSTKNAYDWSLYKCKKKINKIVKCLVCVTCIVFI